MDILPLLSAVNGSLKSYENVKKLYGARLAPDFFLFDFIRTDELGLSKAIAWLLDPAGKHSQGGRFLSLFLKTIQLHWPEAVCLKTSIKLEEHSDLGRVDIILKSASYICIIENKPFADDQALQLSRYFELLDQSGASDKSIAYLTSDGRYPSTKSLSANLLSDRVQKRQLHLISYRNDIINWLSECKAVCEADRVRVFIDEFIRFIDRTFVGTKDMTVTDQMIDSILLSSDNVSAALEIIAARNLVRNRLFFMLEAQVREMSKSRNWETKSHGNPDSKFFSLVIEFSKDCPYRFALEFQNTNYAGPVFGLQRRDEGSQEIADEGSDLRANLGHGTTNLWWLWYREVSPTDQFLPLDRNWDQTSAPWTAIFDKTMASCIFKTASNFEERLRFTGVIADTPN